MTKLYSIRDSKAEHFLPLMEAQNDEIATRMVADAIHRGVEQLALHRNDYYLYCLAEYDNVSGEIIPMLPQPIESLSAIIDKYFKPQTEPAAQMDIEETFETSELGADQAATSE